mmetsp:Transcript_45985/g.51279  ORF Transcript_45985/g.51279 Transcript_45985/m.51279 type:complete len:103 (-) Transcript_45985:765-1073(-)
MIFNEAKKPCNAVATWCEHGFCSLLIDPLDTNSTTPATSARVVASKRHGKSVRSPWDPCPRQGIDEIEETAETSDSVSPASVGKSRRPIESLFCAGYDLVFD